MLNQPNYGISSPADSPQVNPQGYKDIYYELEQMLGADVERVNSMVQQGVVSSQQGAYLLSRLQAKAHQINQLKQSEQINNIQPQAQVQDELPVSEDAMTLFSKEHPGFFEKAGRGDVLNYIKGLDMDKDEILRIAQLVENLENAAIENYLKKSKYEKSLNDENALAKSKLTAYAQNSSSDGNFNKIFTREEIGAMSGEEFTKNEKAIMQQLKQGMIK